MPRCAWLVVFRLAVVVAWAEFIVRDSSLATTGAHFLGPVSAPRCGSVDELDHDFAARAPFWQPENMAGP